MRFSVVPTPFENSLKFSEQLLLFLASSAIGDLVHDSTPPYDGLKNSMV
jgi:hypothetical protein